MQYINIPAGSTYPLILGEDILAMNTSKIYLQCNTVGVGSINILLPKITIPAGDSIKNWFLEIFINDIGNNASVNNIKITPSPLDGGDKINGSASQITLNTNGSTGRLVITGKTAWDYSAGGGSGSGVAVEGQVYTKVSPLAVANNSPVVWTAVQNGSGVTLNSPTNNKIRVSTAGTYQIDWTIELFSQSTPS